MAAHVPSELIAAYVDGALEDHEVREVEDHLSVCVSCRMEAGDVESFIRRRRTSRRWKIAAPAAAAVLAGIIFLGPGAFESGGPPPSNLRSIQDAAEREAVLSVDVVAPREDEPVPADAFTFVWRSLAEGSAYRLTMTDESGRPVWSAETSDTTATPEADVKVDPDRTYLWYVDALLPDGREATSGVHLLTTRPASP